MFGLWAFDVGPDDTFVFYSIDTQQDGDLVWYRTWPADLQARAGEFR